MSVKIAAASFIFKERDYPKPPCSARFFLEASRESVKFTRSRVCVVFSAKSFGEVREWLNRLAWKVSYRQKRYVGSNPTLSASAGVCYWRGARVVESAGLENRNTLRGIEGSNPSLSAKHNGSGKEMCWTYVLWSDMLRKRYVGSTVRTPEERLR